MNLRDRIREIFSSKKAGTKRNFHPFVLILEPSFACNLSCRMCTRGKEVAAEAIMSEDVFSKIEPYLHWFMFVHQCGFGEPLMSPWLEQMVKRICNQGCLVSLVSNGLLLTKERIASLLAPDIKINEIAISIDAAHKELYEAIRGKSKFKRLLENLSELKRQKERLGNTPQLTWAFLVMKSNFTELPEAVELAAEMGFDRIVGKHMETANSREELAEAMFDTGYLPPPDAETEIHFQATLHEARKRAEKSGIKFEMHPRRMIINGTCAAQPLQALYIDYAGNVSPCCYLNVQNFRPYLIKQPRDNGVLGNLLENSLEEILASEKFRKFIVCWAEGTLPPVCRGCLLARRMKL